MHRLDPTTKGAVLLGLLVMVESIQLVIVLGLIYSLISFAPNPHSADFFPAARGSMEPDRQMPIYHIFIVAGILGQAAAAHFFKTRIKDPGFQSRIKQLLLVDAGWVAIQLFAVFKISIYKGAGWPWGWFYAGLTASVLSRVFWPEMLKGWGWMRLLVRPLEEEMRRGHEDRPMEVYLWFPLFVVVESVQAVIGINFLLGHTAAPVFTLAVFMAGLGFFSFVWNSGKKGYFKDRPFIAAETLITFFLLSALYKMVIYDYRPQLATHAFHVLLAVALLNKIIWGRLWAGTKALWAWAVAPGRIALIRTWGDILFPIFIVLTINIPDPQAVIAKMFFGDEFIHTGSFIMSPGWAWVKGCVMDVDVISRYGLGIPVVVGALAKALGGFNHLHVFLVILWIAILYYLLCYLFLRLWLKSFLLAAAAILVGIKTQLFYTLSFPQPFTYPSATPVRFMLDIVFMLCIWGHLQRKQWWLLMGAACCAGTSFFLVPETGIYLTVAFYGYMALLAMVPALRHKTYGSTQHAGAAVFCGLAVPASAFLLMWWNVGGHLWTKEFWGNFLGFYFDGSWVGPFDGGLKYGQFWDLLIGMLFPVVYGLTILIIGTLCVWQKIPEENLMAVVLSIYGLMTHHYYVVMATANNYYPRGLAFVFVVFYWAGWLLSGFDRGLRRKLAAGLVAFSAYCLWTNHHYLSYPNVFNFSPNPLVDPMVAEHLPDGRYYFHHRYIDYPENLKLPLNSLGQTDEELRTEKDFGSDQELKDYYQKETDFSKDVRLIRSLVPRQEPLALVSNYDTEFMMQADRRPLFYYFRLFSSRPLHMRSYGATELGTKTELKKTIGQLETRKPEYIFMERVFLQAPSPQQAEAYDPALLELISYIKAHYQPAATGEYLVAMKRKDQGEK